MDVQDLIKNREKYEKACDLAMEISAVEGVLSDARATPKGQLRWNLLIRGRVSGGVFEEAADSGIVDRGLIIKVCEAWIAERRAELEAM